MKIKWQHPEQPKTGRRHWRSEGELRDTPEFREWLSREFPAAASEMSVRETETSRRSFLKYMGAASALMGFGMTGCRRPEEKIVPFAHNVEWSIPGQPLYYSSVIPCGDDYVSVVVTTHDGRPNHMTGNRLHPDGGGLNARSTASILDMYEPSRSRVPLKGGSVSTLAAFDADLKKLSADWKAVQGKGVAILVGSDYSPTRDRLLRLLKERYSGLAIYRYAPLERVGAVVAAEAQYGAGARLVPNLTGVAAVFSLDCDFLGLDRVGGRATADFMEGRKCDKPGVAMNRLYSVENRYTLTGGMADHRLNLPASLIYAAAARLAVQLGVAGVKEAGGLTDGQKKWVDVAATDLKAQGAKAVVLAGGWQAPAVHALAMKINEKLGSAKTAFKVVVRSEVEAKSVAELREAVERNEVSALISLVDSDPVYDIPDWAPLHGRIPQTIHLGVKLDATAKASTWHLNGAHYMERWGDGLSLSGVYSVMQPMIAPLFDGLSDLDMLLVLLGKKELIPAPPVKDAPAEKTKDPAYLAVRETFAAMAGDKADSAWALALRNGFYQPAAGAAGAAGAGVDALLAAYQPIPAPDDKAFEVVFAPDHSVWDGRYIDNSWLQEMPDPITKLTWGNAAQLNPNTFRALGLKKDGDIIDVTLNGKKLSIPAMLSPGHARNSVTLPVGYGQTVTGPVGKGVGVDVGVLRNRMDHYVAPGAQVVKGTGTVTLPTTAEHFSMEGRALAREGTVRDFEADPNFAQIQGEDAHIPPNHSLYKGLLGKKSEKNPEGFDYDAHEQWGMVIDLNACTGCNACLVACQSENNIPVVGPDEVINSREMHWIRMDRYFSIVGDTLPKDQFTDEDLFSQMDNPEMLIQPVACQQCESAPCETVCPVNATIHSEEGLNLMAYNRCIGTRYCANNCPYKARRFNFFDYNKRDVLAKEKFAGTEYGNLYFGPLGKKNDREMVALQKNPNVTVRMRGVMEKCTYCIQRIEEAKISQRAIAKGSANVRVPKDKVKTACQESCPTDAITFGDLGYEDSAVSVKKRNPRNYTLLKYIGTEPRTTYLAKIKNPYSGGDAGPMPGSENIGKATSSDH